MSQAEELQELGLDPADEAVLPPAETARWLEALAAAVSPQELAPADNDRLVDRLLDDPLAPPTAAELAAAAELRDALATGGDHPDAELLAALRAPFVSPAEADDASQRVAQVLATDAAPRQSVIYVTFGAAGLALAAAAALLLTVGAFRTKSAEPDSAELFRPRSTAPLFSERFDADVTARVDRIASARSRDLRENRYVAWGVK